MPNQPPQLPPGTSSILSGASENFSFHSSPESFITNRILQYHKDRPEDVKKRTTVRAKILNRNVAVVSSYDQAKQVLDPTQQTQAENKPPPYVATAPYNRLMEPFFPPPNLLLNDGCPHQRSKSEWQQHFQPLLDSSCQTPLRASIDAFLSRIPHGAPLDLYATCKDLGWRIFLQTFLNLTPQTPGYDEFEKLQEDLLRGQFSLFPVTVNTGFWHSPRKVGIDSRKKLQTLISQHLEKDPPGWLSSSAMAGSIREETVNHLLMATSSLAVKGFASLLTALLLNLFVYRQDKASGQSLAAQIHASTAEQRASKRQAVLSESLRVSPPIVGVMRRSTQENVISTTSEAGADVLIPQGWDVWPYFAGANRDPAAFGQDADEFVPTRYLQDTSNPPEPISFGLGPKRCLGQSFVQNAALAVVKAFEDQNLSVEGSVADKGVRAWLGWERAEPGVWAKDMKQLPTQHPARPIMVRFAKGD